MRILRVISTMNPKNGGPSQGIRNSIPALREIGIINDVVSFDSPDSAFLENDDFTIYALGCSKGPWQYNSLLRTWLIENVRKYNAVIIHGLWLYNGYGTYKAIKDLKKEGGDYPFPKVFVMPHGMLDPYFQKSSGRRLKALRNLVYWNLIESKIVNGVDGILFTCEEELRLAKSSFSPYHPKRELNIGYGILPPPPMESRMKLAFYKQCSITEGTRFLLFLSRIQEKKGIDLLIDAFLELEGSGITLPSLVIAGPGLDTSFGSRIKESASMSSNIHFTGMLGGDAKWGAFYECEAFILPSHQENFGIAIVEALSCSKPVIISNKVNIWREIAEESAGIVGDDTLNGTKVSISQWIKKGRQEQELMGARAKIVVDKFFTVQAAALRMRDCINEVLGRNHE